MSGLTVAATSVLNIFSQTRALCNSDTCPGLRDRSSWKHIIVIFVQKGNFNFKMTQFSAETRNLCACGESYTRDKRKQNHGKESGIPDLHADGSHLLDLNSNKYIRRVRAVIEFFKYLNMPS